MTAAINGSEGLRQANERLMARRAQQGIAPALRPFVVRSPAPAEKEAEAEVAQLAPLEPAQVGRVSFRDTASADDSDDALSTLLPPDAEVVVGFVDEKRKTMFRRDTWIVRLRIIEGDHAGKLISWWLRALRSDADRVPRGSSICTSFVAATGLRPPRHLARLKPSHWLADAQYLVSTRQVVKDVHGVDRAEAASYSVVSAILARFAGTPPALGGRRR